MPNYYELLQVKNDAPEAEIKKAYASFKNQNLEKHQNENSSALEEAYCHLINGEKRYEYDTNVLNLKPNYKKRFSGTKYRLAINPDEYTHYEYYNHFFYLEDEEAINPARSLNNNYLWQKIEYVSNMMHLQRRNIWRENWRLHQQGKLPLQLKNKLHLLEQNINKIGNIQGVLFSDSDRKMFYDLTLGHCPNAELALILKNLGGIEVLKKAIIQNPAMDFVDGLIALHQSNCLTPNNFKQVMACAELNSVSSILEELQKTHLLSQANFNLLMHNQRYADSICRGVGDLASAGILNQLNFKVVVEAKQKADYVGCNLETLKHFGLLNQANWEMVVECANDFLLFHQLQALKDANKLHAKHKALVMWKGPSTLRPVNTAIDQMFAHGLFLLGQYPQKGKIVLRHALSLKNQLKTFSELPLLQQKQQCRHFKQQFMQNLHRADVNEMMALHREEWKVIVANVAIAFTGIGLLLIADSFFTTGRFLFEKTNSEEHIETIDKAFMTARLN